MSGTGLPSLPAETVDQAIQWAVRLTYNQPDPAAHQAFEAWLASDESHRLAWARLQSLNQRFAGVSTGLARQTLEKLPEARLQRRQVLNLLALFATVGSLAWSSRDSGPVQRLLADYSTRVGEHQRWTLADGSLLELNTDSAVRLRFDSVARVVQLLRGELYLVSGADASSVPHRPLRVATGLGQFEALGTRFSVRQDSGSCRLGVDQGAVRLQPLAGGGATAQAGETWLMTSNSVQHLPGTANDAGAWRDGLLTARSLPLAELLAELGRYRSGYLGCDPQIASRPISGNFNLYDIDATLAFIARSHGLRLHAITRYWLRISA